VCVARKRGVDAAVLPIENLHRVPERFDGAISNFGALNCVADIEELSRALASLIRPGGYLAVCVLGRFCLWETLWYLSQGKPLKAFRRWRSGRVASSLRVRVHHFSISQIEQAFRRSFTMVDWCGIGLAVPPSYVTGVPGWLLNAFGFLDRGLEQWPVFRALADHRLAVFVRK
jgi:hypothetical protein